MVWGWFSLTGANRLHTGKPVYPLLTTPTPSNHPILSLTSLCTCQIPCLPRRSTPSSSLPPHLPCLLILNSFQDPSRSTPCTTVIQHDTGRAAQPDENPGNLHHSNPSSVAEPVDSPRFPRQTIRMTDDQIEMRPANENPWYVLATYHGEQTGDELDKDLHAKNREVWNRWMAAALSDEDRQELINEERATAAELKPFSPEERRELWAGCRSPGLPAPDPAADINLRNTVFVRTISFDHLIFPTETMFVRSEFQEDTNFSQSLFRQDVDFGNAVFQSYAAFQYTAFQGNAHFWFTAFRGGHMFQHAAFQKNAIFMHATFRFKAVFLNASFQKYAVFQHATFQRDSDFRNVSFRGYAVFQFAAFQGGADFRDATFHGDAYFDGSAKRDDSRENRQFAGRTYFYDATFFGSANFTNREFLDITLFSDAKFLNRAPIFADTKLHEGTTWHGVQWPQTPDHPEEARDMADAYSHLRRRSNAIQDHEAELDFYGRELRAKRAAVGGATGLLISLYEWSCGFGASVGLPFFWLLGLWTGMAPVYHLILQHAGKVGIDPMQIYGFSLASLGGFFGMRKEFFGHFTENLPAMAQTLSGAQSLLGAVFVFLLGLSLRNRFRIK